MNQEGTSETHGKSEIRQLPPRISFYTFEIIFLSKPIFSGPSTFETSTYLELQYLQISNATIMQETFANLTGANNQDFGITAGIAVQQRLGPDVEVQQRSRASQLGEGEPQPHELRLVAEQKGDGVTLLQLGVLGQSSGHLVAFFVGLAVRIWAVLKEQKGLLWLLGHPVQKTIQNAVKRFPPPESIHLYADFDCGHSVT